MYNMITVPKNIVNVTCSMEKVEHESLLGLMFGKTERHMFNDINNLLNEMYPDRVTTTIYHFDGETWGDVSVLGVK